jgi:hypothetical protein
LGGPLGRAGLKFKGVVASCSPCVDGEGSRIGQAKLVSKGGAGLEHRNRMSCSVSARVPGAGGAGQQIGVVGAWVVVAGHEKTEDAQKLRRQGSASGIRR